MNVEEFKDILGEHGVDLKGSAWGSVVTDLRRKLPEQPVGTAWMTLSDPLRKLYVSTPGIPAGLLLTETADLIRAAHVIKERYTSKTPVVSMRPAPKYVKQWGDVIKALEAAGTWKLRGLRSTPTVDKFRETARDEGLNSRAVYEVILTKLLGGDEEALQAFRELLEENVQAA